jgi:glycine dehydrogenase subunit 1
MGKEGIKKAADLCVQKSHYMYDKLIQTGKFESKFSAPFFKEFVLTYKGKDLHSFQNSMMQAGFMPGIDLGHSAGLNNCILITVTEKRTKEEIDAYIKKAGEIL